MIPDASSDMQILSEMFADDALIKANNRSVELRERQSPDSMVMVSNLPPDALIINADGFNTPFDVRHDAPKQIFKGTKHERKRADFIIISEKKKYIVYIEMKLSTAEGRHITQQLRGARCFISYCQEIGKTFWDEETFLSGYKSRFVTFFHTGNIQKRQTQFDPGEKPHDTPENPLKVRWVKSIQFNEIAHL